MIILDIDYKQIDDAKKLLKNIPFALARAKKMAARAALEAMRAEAVRQAQEIYAVKGAAVRKAIHLVPTQGIFKVTGRRIGTENFYMTPRKPPKLRRNWKGLNVMVKREGGVKRVPKGFLLNVDNGGKALPFIRTGAGRWAGLKRLMSPAVPQMIENYDVMEPVLERGEQVFMNQFNYWIDKTFEEIWYRYGVDEPSQVTPRMIYGSRSDWSGGNFIYLPGRRGADPTGWH